MGEKIRLPYGREGLDVDLSDYRGRYTIIAADRRERLPELTADHLSRSFDSPIASAPLGEIIGPGESVCIVTSDGTRPFPPMRFMLHAILNHLSRDVKHVRVVTGSGSHRPHSEEELRELFCARLLDQVRVTSHDSRSDDNVEVGRFSDGTPVTVNRRYMEADRKIVLGIIEPHMFVGYSGGPKGVAPAICGIETIRRLHGYDVIADPSATYGNLEDNAGMAILREAAALAPPDFLVNLVLDSEKRPVGVFSGHYIEAHRAGVRLARRVSEVAVTRRYPVVITSNAGYPLDQNLYQTVKGIAAASLITQPQGTIIVVSECSRGVPEGSAFERLLISGQSVETLLSSLANEKRAHDDRWQVQRLGQALDAYRVILVSSLDETTTSRCRLGYAASVEAALDAETASRGGRFEFAVLVDGPMTVPRPAGNRE